MSLSEGAASSQRFVAGMLFWNAARHDGDLSHDGEAPHMLAARYGLLAKTVLLTGARTAGTASASAGFSAGMRFWEQRFCRNGEILHDGTHDRGNWIRYDLAVGKLAFSLPFATSGSAGAKTASASGMDFWGRYSRKGGETLHDGSVNREKGSRYDLIPRIGRAYGSIKTDSITALEAAAFTFGMRFHATGGKKRHWGELRHDGNHMHGLATSFLAAAVRIHAGTGLSESVGASVFTRCRNPEFHNGQNRRDGTARYNTIYKKEVIA